MTDMTDFQRELAALGACDEARTWVAGQTREEAWQNCPRGDWLLWYLSRTSPRTDTRGALYWCLERTRQLLLQVEQDAVIEVPGPFYPEPVNLKDALKEVRDFIRQRMKALDEKYSEHFSWRDFLQSKILCSAYRIYNFSHSPSDLHWIAQHNIGIAEDVAKLTGTVNNEADFVRLHYKLERELSAK